MTVRVRAFKTKGTVCAPHSKSVTQRAYALALLHVGETLIKGAGESHDDIAAMSIIKKLGAEVSIAENGSINITGSKKITSRKINAGESGLSLRMFTPIAALSSDAITITGKGSLRTRPVHFFDVILPQLAVETQTDNGHLPIIVRGPLQPINITVDGSLSSQFITGLLISLASVAKEPLTLTVSDLKSKPYIELTLDMLSRFGYNVSTHNYETFQILPKAESTEKIDFEVEADWSGAAFLLVAAAISGKAFIKGLRVDSFQADKAIIDVLKSVGAEISVSPKGIKIKRADLNAFNFDATDCPDLFPPLVALASFCNGKSTIKGVHRLKHKESDRGQTLQEEFGKLGVQITMHGDEMYIVGQPYINGGKVHSHNDHRIAMALAVSASRSIGNVVIGDAQAINKSYPDFFKDLKKIGGKLKIKNK